MLQLNCKILQQRLDMFSLCFHWCNIGPQQCSKGQIAVGVSEGQGWGFYVLPRSVGMRRSTLALLIGYLPAGTQSNSVLAAKQELRKQRRQLCSSQQEQWSCGVAGWRNEGATCSPQLNTLWRRERVFLLYTETAMIFTALLRTKWPQCCLGINRDVNTNGSNNTSCAEITALTMFLQIPCLHCSTVSVGQSYRQKISNASHKNTRLSIQAQHCVEVNAQSLAKFKFDIKVQSL